MKSPTTSFKYDRFTSNKKQNHHIADFATHRPCQNPFSSKNHLLENRFVYHILNS